MKILCLFPLSDAGQTIHEVLKRCPDLTSVLVHSNRDACQEIASGKYHTIVTSHNPPDIDLFGILDYLSSLEIPPPVILTTEEADTEFLKKAMHAGLRTWYPLSNKTLPDDDSFTTLIQTIAKEFSTQYSSEFYQDLVDKAGDLIQSIGKDSRFIFVNQKWKDVLGYSDDEIKDLTIFDILSDPTCESSHERFSRICSGEDVGLISMEFAARDGRVIPVEGYATAKMKDGKFIHTRCVFRDVSEQRQIEREREQTREKFEELYRLLRQMCDNIPDMIWAKDLNRNYLFVNQSMCDNLLIAETTDEPIGKNDIFFAERQRIHHPDNPHYHTFGEICQDTDTVVMASEQPERFDEFGNVKNRFLFLDVFKAPFFDENGQMIGTVGCGRDVTKNKEQENLLQESRKRLQNIFDNTLDGIVILSLDANVLFSNRAAMSLVGSQIPSEIIGKTIFDFVAPESYEAAKQDFAELVSGEPLLREYRISSSQDEERWVETYTSEIIYEGTPAYLMTVREITARIFAERLITVQRDVAFGLAGAIDLKSALDLCLENILVITDMDSGGIYLFEDGTNDLVLENSVNLSESFIAETSRYTSDSYLTTLVRNGKAFFSGYDMIKIQKLRPVLDEGLHALGIIPIQSADGVIGTINIASHSKDAIDESQLWTAEVFATQIGSFIRRLKAEDRVHQNEHELQAIFDSIDEFMFVLGSDGNILRVNKKTIDDLGYSEKELLRMNVLDVHPPERRTEAAEIVADMMAGNKSFCPVPLQCKDGTQIPVETKVTQGFWKDQSVLFGISRDISERIRSDHVIQSRNAILDAINYAASTFLQAPSWKNEISGVLARLGKATHIDRVYIFENHNDDETGQTLTSHNYEWVDKGISPQIDNPDLQNVSYTEVGYSRWEQQFRKGLTIAGNLSEFPASEHEILASQGICSIAAVPIFVDNIWWGFIGFDSCQEEHPWDTIETQSLKVAAGILGAAIERERRESEMKESEEIFRKPVEHSLVGVYILQDTVIKYANPFLCSLLGYTMDEVTFKIPFMDLVVPEHRVLVTQSIKKFFVNRDIPHHLEISFITKDGRRIDAELYNSVLSYHGRPAVVGNLLDITEKKEAEDELRTSLMEKEVLLKEIHHRVKNNLQVLLSMATLQELNYQKELEENSLATRILSDMEKRIKAIALVYDYLISTNDFTGIQLHVHLEALVEEFLASSIGEVYISYSIKGEEDIVIPMDQAVVLSLIVSEILTNAAMHAFVGRDFGEVTITVYRDPDTEEILCLDIADDGIGLPANIDLKTTESVGLSIIYNVVTFQLKGSVELKEGMGTCYKICIPLSSQI